ncbi:MAG: hypothetical protein MUD08_00090 [Cytophagales bacterium]|nr:hypothetical protein [Cytophagales bacterium]
MCVVATLLRQYPAEYSRFFEYVKQIKYYEFKVEGYTLLGGYYHVF